MIQKLIDTSFFDEYYNVIHFNIYFTLNFESLNYNHRKNI